MKWIEPSRPCARRNIEVADYVVDLELPGGRVVKSGAGVLVRGGHHVPADPAEDPPNCWASRLHFGYDEFAAFLEAAKAGEYDHLVAP